MWLLLRISRTCFIVGKNRYQTLVVRGLKDKPKDHPISPEINHALKDRGIKLRGRAKGPKNLRFTNT